MQVSATEFLQNENKEGQFMGATIVSTGENIVVMCSLILCLSMSVCM